MKRFTLLAFVLFAALPGFADSTFDVFVLVSINPKTEIQLTADGNPLVHSVFSDSNINFDIPSFESTLPATITIDTIIGGQPLPFFSMTFTSNPLGLDVSIPAPFFPEPVPGVVTVTINGQAETFNFRFFTDGAPPPPTPVPEPTSLILMGTGLAAVVWRRFDRKQRIA